ncbi:MAG: hypothetical protein AAF663_10125, partial [Planctomycetota bacterium]
AAGLYLAALLLPSAWVASSASAGVAVQVDWSDVRGTVEPDFFGLNVWNGTNPNVSSQADYQANLARLSPGVTRVHAAEMLQPGSSKAWVNLFGVWQTDTIDQVLSALGPNTNEVMLNVPTWFGVWNGPGGTLADDRIDDYAAFVADLVDIANNQLGHDVAWVEPFNERDTRYAGNATELAAVHNAVVAAVRAVDPDIRVSAGGWTQPFDDANIRAFIAAVGPENMDAFSYHHYATSGTNADPQFLYDRSYGIGERGDTLRGWLDELPGGEQVELWLGETNLYSSFSNDTQGLMRSEVGAVASALMHQRAIERGSVDVVQPWNDSDNTYGMISPDGSTLRPAGHVRAEMVEHFIGDWVFSTSDSPNDIEVFAAITDDAHTVMLVNRSGHAQTVDLSFLDTTAFSDAYTFTVIDSLGQTTIAASRSFDGTQGFTLAQDTVAFLTLTAIPRILPGDYNGSGSVEQGDLDLVLGGWGSARTGFLNDMVFTTPAIDQEELDAVLANWGVSAIPASSPQRIPEPATGLAFLALAACPSFRRLIVRHNP